MFDVAPQELVLLGTVALLVIPPKDLPRAMRTAGYWIGRARGVARQFRSGFDSMVRDAELAEMETRWKAENERIMREHPPADAEGRTPGDLHVPESIVAKPDPSPAMVAQPALTDGAIGLSPKQPISVEAPTVVAAGPDAAPDADTKASS